jgi:hypothetical protein
MIRNFKALGLAFVAVLAMGAVMASGASAAKIVGSAGAVNIHGAQATNHEFVLTDNSNLKTTCTTATFTGSIPAGGTSTPEAIPIYSGCTAFGLNSTIHTTGCKYVFHIGTFNAAGTPASVDVECGSGAITITTLTCEVKVDTQTGPESKGLTANTGTNTGTDVLLDTSVTQIAYTVTKDGIGCPLKAVGSYTEGDYTGTTTLTAETGTLKIE